jgi:hypothetical protein
VIDIENMLKRKKGRISFAPGRKIWGRIFANICPKKSAKE